MSKGLDRINASRKPNGQFTAETAYRMRARSAGLAFAAKYKDTGFPSLVAAGKLANRKRHLLRLGKELADAGCLCEHTMWLVNGDLASGKRSPFDLD